MSTNKPHNENAIHTVKNFLAHFVSIILIPLLAPMYLFSIILFYFPSLTSITNVNDKIAAIFYIFTATTLPPFIIVFILFKLKKISSLTLDKKSDRLIPQLFSCFNYFVITFFVIYKLGKTDPLALSMIATTCSLIAISIITPFWKISTHSSGVAGILAIATVLYIKHPSSNFLFPYLILVFLTIAACLARFQLKVHTISQILAGCLLGSIIGFLCFIF